MNFLVMAGMATAGAACGPFLRATIFRHSTPAPEQVREDCPHCDQAVTRARRFGWITPLAVTGRCPHCRQRLGPAPMSVELIIAAVLALLAWRIDDWLTLAGLTWAALSAVVLAFTDLAVHRLPNQVVAAALVGTTGALGLTALVHKDPLRLAIAAACGLGTALLYLLLALTANYGLGDVKTSAFTGFTAGWFGVHAAVTALLLGFILTGIIATILLVSRRRHRGDTIAHGPPMLTAALLAIMASAPG